LPEPFGVIIKKDPFQANISLVTELYVMKWGITAGRVDDVVIVSGHNLGTAPLKMLLTSIQQLESAIVGFPHDIKGMHYMALLF
jgi:hypothetical protein